MLGIVNTQTTPYNPQSDGMIKQFNLTVLNMLSTVVTENKKDWYLHFPTLMLAYRTSMAPLSGSQFHQHWKGPGRGISHPTGGKYKEAHLNKKKNSTSEDNDHKTGL